MNIPLLYFLQVSSEVRTQFLSKTLLRERDLKLTTNPQVVWGPVLTSLLKHLS